MEALPEATEATLGGILGATLPQTQIAAVHLLVDGQAEKVVPMLTQTLGISADQAREQLGEIVGAFERQAYDAVARTGLDAGALFAWATREQPAALSEAMKAHAFDRSTAAYGDLVTSYLIDLERTDPEMILEADFGEGVTVGRTSTGAIFVTLPDGSQSSWEQAIKHGEIRVSGGRR
jgi:hypothetical protein